MSLQIVRVLRANNPSASRGLSEAAPPFSPRLAGGLISFALLLAVISSAAGQPPKGPVVNPDEQKAREAFLAGKLDDALKSLQIVAKGNPSSSPPKITLSRWSLETNQGEQARILLEQAAIEDPSHPEMFLLNASFALREGRITDTILSCTAALAATDNARFDADTKKRFQRDARLGLVAAFDTRADHASAKTHLAALLEADPKNAGLRQRLARSNFLLGRVDDAFADLQAAFKDDPTLDPPELGMAQLWTAKADFTKADAWYTKAVAAHANSAKVHRALAGYSLDRNRLDAAKSHLAAAQKLDPTSRDTKAIAGLLARYTKDYATATTTFEELAKDHPGDAFATANLSLVLAEAGDATGKRRAGELAEVHAKQNPRSAEARAILAYCLFKAGRTADADKVARTALGFGAINPDGAYFLARVFVEATPEEAQKLVKAACESKDGFVYRKDAEGLLAELDKKFPPKK